MTQEPRLLHIVDWIEKRARDGGWIGVDLSHPPVMVTI
jgi:hypothetical protein